jgi:hypothetical protein
MVCTKCGTVGADVRLNWLAEVTRRMAKLSKRRIFRIVGGW